MIFKFLKLILGKIYKNRASLQRKIACIIIDNSFTTEVLLVQWLRTLTLSRKVTGSILAQSIGLFRRNL